MATDAATPATDPAAPAADKKGPLFAEVTLDTAIVRGETEIDKVTVRKPEPGSMRGLTLKDVMELDVNTLIKLLPRITMPMLTEPEVAKMDAADLLALGAEASNFLLPRAARASLGQ